MCAASSTVRAFLNLQRIVRDRDWSEKNRFQNFPNQNSNTLVHQNTLKFFDCIGVTIYIWTPSNFLRAVSTAPCLPEAQLTTRMEYHAHDTKNVCARVCNFVDFDENKLRAANPERTHEKGNGRLRLARRGHNRTCQDDEGAVTREPLAEASQRDASQSLRILALAELERSFRP